MSTLLNSSSNDTAPTRSASNTSERSTLQRNNNKTGKNKPNEVRKLIKSVSIDQARHILFGTEQYEKIEPLGPSATMMEKIKQDGKRSINKTLRWRDTMATHSLDTNDDRMISPSEWNTFKESVENAPEHQIQAPPDNFHTNKNVPDTLLLMRAKACEEMLYSIGSKLDPKQQEKLRERLDNNAYTSSARRIDIGGVHETEIDETPTEAWMKANATSLDLTIQLEMLKTHFNIISGIDDEFSGFGQITGKKIQDGEEHNQNTVEYFMENLAEHGVLPGQDYLNRSKDIRQIPIQNYRAESVPTNNNLLRHTIIKTTEILDTRGKTPVTFDQKSETQYEADTVPFETVRLRHQTEIDQVKKSLNTAFENPDIIDDIQKLDHYMTSNDSYDSDILKTLIEPIKKHIGKAYEIKKVPELELLNNPEDSDDSFFGFYDPKEDKISINLKSIATINPDNTTLEIINTLAHELYHRKQDELTEQLAANPSSLTEPEKVLAEIYKFANDNYVSPERSCQLTGKNHLYRNNDMEYSAFALGDYTEALVKDMLSQDTSK